MTRKKKYAIFFALILVVGAISLKTWSKNHEGATSLPDTRARTIRLKDKTIKVMVADTPELRAKGLSGREGLARDEGMLFIFDSDGKYQFWMKDMRFNVDILWISDKGEVVDIKENASPSIYPAVFAPNSPARYVLELPAGFVRENLVTVGDIVRL